MPLRSLRLKGRDKCFLVTSPGFPVHGVLQSLLGYSAELLLRPFASVSSSRGTPVFAGDDTSVQPQTSI